MYIIIVGGGKVGYYLAKTLAQLRYRITVLETNRDLCMNIVNAMGDLGVNVINGDGTNMNFLKDADIELADALIAVTGRDQDNLIVCQIAKKEFNTKKTIARVNNPKNIKIFEKLGVDFAISSTATIVDIIEKEVFISDLKSVMTVGNLIVNGIKLKPGFHSINKKVKDLELPKDCILISIIRNSNVMIPNGSSILMPEDEIIAVSKKGDEIKLEKALGKME